MTHNPPKQTYFKLQLLLGAGTRVIHFLHSLLISTAQAVGLLRWQGHCGEAEGKGRKIEIRVAVPCPQAKSAGLLLPCLLAVFHVL